MGKSLKILLGVFILIVLISFVYTFYKTIIQEDFKVVYCDESGCYNEMQGELLEEEQVSNNKDGYQGNEEFLDENVMENTLNVERDLGEELEMPVLNGVEEDVEYLLKTNESI